MRSCWVYCRGFGLSVSVALNWFRGGWLHGSCVRQMVHHGSCWFTMCSWPCELPCSFSGAIWNQLMPCLSLLFYLPPSHPVHFLWCALLAPGCIWLWFSAGHPPAALDALLYFGNPCVSAPICRFILVGPAGFAVTLLGM